MSLTIDHDTADLMAITGLSMAARAKRVTDRTKAENPRNAPLQISRTVFAAGAGPDDVAIFSVTPTVISVLDYSQGFGHTDLVFS